MHLGEGSATKTYLYNPQNRLTATISTSGEETKYIYDNNGNLLTKASGISLLKTIQEGEGKDSLPSFDLVIRKGDIAGTGTKDLTFYTYDNYNRMISSKVEDTTSTYRYNAQGYRVEKTVNGETTKYLYEYDKVVLETDEDNNKEAFNLYGISLLYRESQTLDGTGSEGYYYIYNAHGDVTSLIDKAGNIAATYDYDAFGNILSETGTADNPIRYAGYQYDIESGLYYLNARYYDSKIARFITEDTYRGEANDPLSLNLYAYCANNPIVYVDPSGHNYFNGKEWISSLTPPQKHNSQNSVFDYEFGDKTIAKGSKGADVEALQRMLMDLGYDLGVYKDDGSFGGTTKKAVEAYQRDHGLKVDGRVGPATKEALLNEKKPTNQTKKPTVEPEPTGEIKGTGKTAKISEKELYNELKDLRKSHLKTTTKMKSLYSSNNAVDVILGYDNIIDEVGSQLNVPKEMIQSVLYREIICYGIDDVAKDLVVRQYYGSKNIPIPGTTYDFYNFIGLDGEVRDSSTV